MRFLKPVCYLTILDNQMTLKNRLERDIVLEDLKARHKNSLDHQKRMDKNRIEKLTPQKQSKGQRDLRRPRRRRNDQENFQL